MTSSHASFARDVLTERNPEVRSIMIDKWVSNTTARYLKNV